MKIEIGWLACFVIAVVATTSAQEPARRDLPPTIKADQELLDRLEREQATSKLTPQQRNMLEQRAEHLWLKTKADVEAEPVGPGRGGGGIGAAKQCLQDCSKVFSRCRANAGGSFQRYLCDIDATKCSITAAVALATHPAC